MLRVASMTSLILAVAAGCLDVEEDTGSANQEINNCEDGPCPKNSPVISTFAFWELHTGGAPNDQHITYDKLIVGSTAYDMRVEKGRIVGVNGMGTVSGAGLTGGQIWIRRGSQKFVIRILGVQLVSMWARDPSGAYPVIETYRMDWSNVTPSGPDQRRPKNICADAQLRQKDSRDLMGVPGDVTFVFEGERIDPFKKTIYDFDPAGQWVNFGCAGHTLSKMMLTGHVQAVRGLGYTNDFKQSQAMMKMMAGDYCGKGHSFTKAGVWLDWQIADGSMKYYFPTASLVPEARWDQDGATCLSVPRAEKNPTADTLATWPLPGDVIADIWAYCGILATPCGGPVDDMAGHHLISAVP
jgi:hypothetical protein